MLLDPEIDITKVRSRRRLLAYTQEQYRRLASLPAMAFALSSFDPKAAVQMLRERSDSIGRGATIGELLEILPAEETGPVLHKQRGHSQP